MLKKTIEQTNAVHSATIQEHKEWIEEQSETMQIMENTVNTQMKINTELNLKIQELQKALDQKNA